MAVPPEIDRNGPDRPRLDEVDRRLVIELQDDGRASYASLATRVGMSQAAVRARVQRLLDTGVVKVAAVADPFAFGFTITAMIGITHVGDLFEVGRALEALDQVHFVALTAGRYDALAEVVCTDADDLLQLVNDHVRTIPGVGTVDVLTYLRIIKHWQPIYVRPGL